MLDAAIWQLCTTFVGIAGPVLVSAAMVSGIVSWALTRAGVQDPMLVAVLRWCCIAMAVYWTADQYSAEIVAFTREMWRPVLLSGQAQ